jgi:hypothetical protein
MQEMYLMTEVDEDMVEKRHQSSSRRLQTSMKNSKILESELQPDKLSEGPLRLSLSESRHRKLS